MIVTGIFLLFATVPLVCVADEKVKSPQCGLVTTRSFPPDSAPQPLAFRLGVYCSLMHPETNGSWIGVASSGVKDCVMCCVNNDGRGNLNYFQTQIPNNFPCGNGKKCIAGTCK
uniref:Putative ixostatin n=1 Tax=Ixodes ricinus TaxID=34613 RepID=A0A0K8RLL7_IXORI